MTLRIILIRIKNILQLTKDLKETQEELIELRGTTKELYEVLGYFKESAQRRLELEFEPETQKELHLPQKVINWVFPVIKRKIDHQLWCLKMWDSQLQSLFKHVDGASKLCNHYPIDTLSRKVDDGLKLMWGIGNQVIQLIYLYLMI